MQNPREPSANYSVAESIYVHSGISFVPPSISYLLRRGPRGPGPKRAPSDIEPAQDHIKGLILMLQGERREERLTGGRRREEVEGCKGFAIQNVEGDRKREQQI